MKNRSTNRPPVAVLITFLAAVGLSGGAMAHGGGGHGGGGAGGHGGGGRGGYGGGYAGRGGYGGGYGGRGGYAGRGGYGGYAGRGGYGGYRGGWGGGYRGWGGGLGIGLYFASLPFYYSTFWGDGVPYYYADDNYYQWNGDVGQYETVNPPPEVQRQAAMQSPTLMAYPKNGQSDTQQATDKSECQSWASAQSGFDPTPVPGTQGTTNADKRSNYMRAQAACLEGRGYSVQ
jgi:hypothetical protein